VWLHAGAQSDGAASRARQILRPSAHPRCSDSRLPGRLRVHAHASGRATRQGAPGACPDSWGSAASEGGRRLACALHPVLRQASCQRRRVAACFGQHASGRHRRSATAFTRNNAICRLHDMVGRNEKVSSLVIFSAGDYSRGRKHCMRRRAPGSSGRRRATSASRNAQRGGTSTGVWNASARASSAPACSTSTSNRLHSCARAEPARDRCARRTRTRQAAGPRLACAVVVLACELQLHSVKPWQPRCSRSREAVLRARRSVHVPHGVPAGRRRRRARAGVAAGGCRGLPLHGCTHVQAFLSC